ncbi:hypothetical protein CC79DRAFT_1325655 [Sarocladium strictum]
MVLEMTQLKSDVYLPDGDGRRSERKAHLGQGRQAGTSRPKGSRVRTIAPPMRRLDVATCRLAARIASWVTGCVEDLIRTTLPQPAIGRRSHSSEMTIAPAVIVAGQGRPGRKSVVYGPALRAVMSQALQSVVQSGCGRQDAFNSSHRWHWTRIGVPPLPGHGTAAWSELGTRAQYGNESVIAFERQN